MCAMKANRKSSSFILDETERIERLYPKYNISSHFFSPLDHRTYVSFINASLGNDPDLAPVLPISLDNDEALCAAVKPGVLLCKLLNLYIPGAVPLSDINLRVYDERSHFNKVENHQHFIKAAKDSGCPLPCVGLGDLIDPKTHIVLAVIDQIVTAGILRRCDEWKRYLELDETTSNSTGKELVMRWGNSTLDRMQTQQSIRTFGTELADGKAFAYLLHSIDTTIAEQHLPKAQIETASESAVIDAVLAISKALDVDLFVTRDSILQSQKKLNFLFIATLLLAKAKREAAAKGIELPPKSPNTSTTNVAAPAAAAAAAATATATATPASPGASATAGTNASTTTTRVAALAGSTGLMPTRSASVPSSVTSTASELQSASSPRAAAVVQPAISKSDREEIMALVATLQAQNQGVMQDMQALRAILTDSGKRDLAILIDEKNEAEKRAEELQQKLLEEKRKHQQTKRKLKSTQKTLDQTMKANDELKRKLDSSASSSSSSSSSSSTTSSSVASSTTPPTTTLTVMSEFR